MARALVTYTLNKRPRWCALWGLAPGVPQWPSGWLFWPPTASRAWERAAQSFDWAML